MRDWDRFFKHCHIILGVIIASVTFLLTFPRNMNVAADYQALKPIVNSAINFEQKCIKNIELPEKVSLTMNRDYDNKNTIITAKRFYTPDVLAPYIAYRVTLSDNFEVIDTSPNELFIRNYLLKTIFQLLFISIIFGLILPLPVILLFLILYYFFDFILMRMRRKC